MIQQRFWTGILCCANLMLLLGCDLNTTTEPQMTTGINIYHTNMPEGLNHIKLFMEGPEAAYLELEIDISEGDDETRVPILEPGDWHLAIAGYASTEVLVYWNEYDILVERDEYTPVYISWADSMISELHEGALRCEVSFHPFSVRNDYEISAHAFQTQKLSIPIDQDVETILFSELGFGRWEFKARGYDASGYLVAWSEQVVFVGSRDTLSTATPWTSDVLISHSFSAADEGYVFGGTAYTTIVDGYLSINTGSSTAWTWEIFDHGNPGSVTTGSIEFDILFDDQGGYFDFRGHSIQVSDINWGPYLGFHENQIFARSSTQPTNIPTALSYEPGVWYHLRLVFDNNQGNLGEYTIHMNEVGNKPIIADGPYSYYASNGPLVDLVQYSFVVIPQQGGQSVELQVDNLILRFSEP